MENEKTVAPSVARARREALASMDHCAEVARIIAARDAVIASATMNLCKVPGAKRVW